MEQTVNTFNDGMITDLNPLSTPNNVLTSCLNGTFITYDGNEFVLQNDMGNGKVETAYLPSGYVPVGMKEYGGIIYVASHNPISGKSQIGSFPSPERNLSDTELGAPTKTIQINSSHQYDKLELFESQEQKIRPGDKFAISISGANLEDYVTDYNTVGKRYIKLRLAVQDSNNNLKIISDELKPIDPQTGKFLTEEQINKGQIGFWASILSAEQLNSADKHIYNNKMMGRLVIITEVETLSSFEVGWSSISSPDNKNNPYTLEFNLSAKDWEDIYKGVTVSYRLNGSSIQNGDIPENIPSGFKITEVPNTGIFDIDITPHTFIGKLDNFKRSLSIDLSKVNSGEVSLLSWRYYNDFNESANNITISWGLNSYLDQNKYIESVQFRFFDIFGAAFIGTSPRLTENESDLIYTCETRKNYNGYFTESIDYNALPSRKIYIVNICVLVRTRQTNELSYRNFYRFLYTTTLFNQYYVDGTSLDFKDCDMNIALNTVKDTETRTNTINNLGEVSSQSGVIDFTEPSKDDYPYYYKDYKDTATTVNLSVKQELDDKNKYPFEINDSNFTSEFNLTDNSDANVNVSNIENVNTTSAAIQPPGDFLTEDTTYKVSDITMNNTYQLSGDSVSIQTNNYGNKIGIQTMKNETKLSVIVRTPFQFVAESEKKLYSGPVGWFRPYLSNPSGVLGYDIFKGNDSPYYYDFVMIGARRNKGKRTPVAIAQKERVGDPKDKDYNDWPKLYNDKDKERAANWFANTGVSNSLMTGSYSAYGKYVNFMIAAGSKKDWTNANGERDYSFLLWKGSGNKYYIIDACKRQADNLMNIIYNTFKDLYTYQEWTITDQDYWSAGSGIYNKSYKVSTDLKVNITSTPIVVGQSFKIGNEYFAQDTIESKLKKATFLYGDKEVPGSSVITEAQENNIKTSESSFESETALHFDWNVSTTMNILDTFYNVNNQFKQIKLLADGVVHNGTYDKKKIYVKGSILNIYVELGWALSGFGSNLRKIQTYFNTTEWDAKNKVTDILFNPGNINWLDGSIYNIGNNERRGSKDADLDDDYLINCIADLRFDNTVSMSTLT